MDKYSETRHNNLGEIVIEIISYITLLIFKDHKQRIMTSNSHNTAKRQR